MAVLYEGANRGEIIGHVGVEEGEKKLREFKREVQNDPLQNEKPKVKESQKGKKRKAEN